MPNCDACFRTFGIKRGESAYCKSCPSNIDEPEPLDEIDEINTQLDLGIQKGGEMPVDYSKTKEQVEKIMPSKYEFLPKVGEEAEFEIVKIYQVNNPKFNIKVEEERKLETGEIAKVKKDLEFHLCADLTNKKTLIINSFAGYQLFANSKIQDNEKIKIIHKAKGDWKIERIK